MRFGCRSWAKGEFSNASLFALDAIPQKRPPAASRGLRGRIAEPEKPGSVVRTVALKQCIRKVRPSQHSSINPQSLPPYSFIPTAATGEIANRNHFHATPRRGVIAHAARNRFGNAQCNAGSIDTSSITMPSALVQTIDQLSYSGRRE